jgi:hypothetical protein
MFVSVLASKNNGNRFFLSFEAKYPNPEPSKGKKGCAAVADFWREIGNMSKTDALLQLEKFFYQGRSKSSKPLTNLNLDSLP